jgi:hypothetical protein
VACFIISVALAPYFLAFLVLGGVMDVSTPGGLSEESAAASFVGWLGLAGLLAGLVGVGLGIAGVTEKDRQCVLPSLGMILILGVAAMVVALVVLVIMAQPPMGC